MRLSKIVPRLPVSDLQRTIEFYTRILDFQSGEPWPEVHPTFVIMRRDDVEIQFYVPEPGSPEPCGHATLNFDVTDAMDAHQLLASRGLLAEWGPEVYWYGRREFGVRDCDDYLLIFSEATGDPPTCEEE